MSETESVRETDIVARLDAVSTGDGASQVLYALGGIKAVTEDAREEIIRLRRLVGELVLTGCTLAHVARRDILGDAVNVEIENWDRVALPVLKEMQM